METKWQLLQCNSTKLAQLFFMLSLILLKRENQTELLLWYVTVRPSSFSYSVFNLMGQNWSGLAWPALRSGTEPTSYKQKKIFAYFMLIVVTCRLCWLEFSHILFEKVICDRVAEAQDIMMLNTLIVSHKTSIHILWIPLGSWLSFSSMKHIKCLNTKFRSIEAVLTCLLHLGL